MENNPTRNFNFSLIFLIALNLLPHMNLYAAPIIIIGGISILWRLLYEFQKVKLPHFLFLWTLSTLCFTWVYFTYGSLLGLEPGSALMIMAVSLKLIDRNRYHDTMILIFLILLLLLFKVLEEQSLWITVFGIFDLVFVTALLLQLHSPGNLKFNPLNLFRTGGVLLLKTGPFMFLLFFIFPRLSSELSFIGMKKKTSSGFSEIVDPGSIANLATSDATAFRVRFNGPTPSLINRYWMGAILSQNNGMTWSISKNKKKKVNRQLSRPKEALIQEIILQPNYSSWLFALDQPHSIIMNLPKDQNSLRYSENEFFSLNRPSNQAILYKAFSMPKQKLMLSPENMKNLTQIPEDNDPRLLKLVNEIKKQSPNTEKMAHALLVFFQEELKYTLNPGPMKTRNISEFLFEKKIGFCEHFATSFASIMRSAGIPSRVIIGFQGGQANEFGDYLIIKDRDAHAWVELWSKEKKQWVRYDPTYAVAPLRIELGGDVFHSLSEDQLHAEKSSQDYTQDFRNTWSYKIFGRTLLAVDLISTRWNFFLLNYDKEGQKKFLKKIGFKKVNFSFLFLISILILIFFFIWLKYNFKNIKRKGPAQIIYDRLCIVLNKKGYPKKINEGPNNYLFRLEEKLPQLENEFKIFRTLYIPWRYNEVEPTHEEIKKLKKIIKQIK